MKKEEMFDLLGEIDSEIVENAKEYTSEKRINKKQLFVRMVAAAACLALIVGSIINLPQIKDRFKEKGGEENNPYKAIITDGEIQSFEPNIPIAEKTSMTMNVFDYLKSSDYLQWRKQYEDIISKSVENKKEVNQYYQKIIKELLYSENENTVCSPANTYIAFAMLAEVTDGNTRQQLLNMLNAKSIENLRDNANAIWQCNYSDTPAFKSVLANSLWLNGSLKYNDYTLKGLTENYFSSSFIGTPGSSKMDEALQKWTNEHTGNLLTEYTKDMKLSPYTVLDIVSTIYYKAMWYDSFNIQITNDAVFHGTDGAQTVPFMHKSKTMSIYDADNFMAASLDLIDSGSMHFILPKDNIDVNSLISDKQLFNALTYSLEDKNCKTCTVNLSVPKFKISNKIELKDALLSLGVCDVFDADIADFSPLISEVSEIFLSKADHAAMLEIDEGGVTGAAYTELELEYRGMPIPEIIDFNLNKPFIFFVTGADGSILFSGIVRNIK